MTSETKEQCSESSENPLIAVAQLKTTNNVEENLANVTKIVSQAAKRGCVMVFLPEAFAFLGDSTKKQYNSNEEKPKYLKSIDVARDDSILEKYVNLGKRYNIWLSLGGYPMLSKSDKDSKEKIFNCHLIVSNKGEIISKYNKIHLFDVDLPNNISIKESDWSLSGNEMVVCKNIPNNSGINLGLSVCYDLRFPGLYTRLRQFGANVLSIPAAFTFGTGAAGHWEVLLKARAIENQCYVIASAQNGKHNPKRITWGHACVIDPWGTIIAQTSTKQENCFVMCEIDIKMIDRIRMNMPISKHEKPNIYQMKPTIVDYKPKL